MIIIWSFILLFTSSQVYSQNIKKRGLLISKEMQKEHQLGRNIAN